MRRHLPQSSIQTRRQRKIAQQQTTPPVSSSSSLFIEDTNPLNLSQTSSNNIADLFYQKGSNNNNNAPEQLPGPLTLLKETDVVNLERKFDSELYFLPEVVNKNAKRIPLEPLRDENADKRHKSADIIGQSFSSLLHDVPSEDIFGFFNEHQFVNEEEKLSVIRDQLEGMVERCKGYSKHPELCFHNVSVEGHGIAEIYYWCRIFGVNTATFFRAIEIFDKWTCLFKHELNEIFKTLDEPRKEETKARVLMQKPLRICSCIMIASKLHSDLNHQTLTVPEVRKVMLEENLRFGGTAIAESELRVFRMLNYQAHWVTPFELVETIISLLELRRELQPRLYLVSMVYIQFTYINHSDIYRKLKNVVRNHWTNDMDEFKIKYEFNYPLRAAAIVVAASRHIHEEFSRKNIRDLAEIIGEQVEKLDMVSLLIGDMVGVMGKLKPKV